MNIKHFVLLCSMALPLFGLAQSTYCNDYHTSKCDVSDKSGKKWTLHPSSKSGLFKQGSINVLNCPAQSKNDFRFILCYDEALGDKIVMKIKDATSGEIVYTNETDNFSRIFEFSNTKTRKLNIEIQIPKSADAKTVASGCLGVMIQNRKTDKSGF